LPDSPSASELPGQNNSPEDFCDRHEGRKHAKVQRVFKDACGKGDEDCCCLVADKQALECIRAAADQAPAGVESLPVREGVCGNGYKRDEYNIEGYNREQDLVDGHQHKIERAKI
jgi:hypothetical protein